MAIIAPTRQPQGTRFFVTARAARDWFHDDAHEIVLAGPISDQQAAMRVTPAVRAMLHRRQQHETEQFQAGQPNEDGAWHRYGPVGVLALRPAAAARLAAGVRPAFDLFGTRPDAPCDLAGATRFSLNYDSGHELPTIPGTRPVEVCEPL